MHKIRIGAVRQEQVRHGIFDGRFRTKLSNRKRFLTGIELNMNSSKTPNERFFLNSIY